MGQLSDIRKGMSYVNGEPRDVLGLTLHPLKMRDYAEWADAKMALLCRMATFPAEYAVLPYISALYAMEVDIIAQTRKAAGYLERISRVLCLSLNLPIESMRSVVRYRAHENNPRKLHSVVVNTGQLIVAIQPNQFKKVREAIVLMNGEELPDDADNPELVAAKAAKMEVSAPRLKYNVQDLISSVAYNSGVRDKDVLDWTILEFMQRKRAIDRDKQHTINAIIEGYGAKWKHGNPTPSWCFDREEDALHGFTPIGEVLGKLGSSEAWLEQEMNKGD